MERTSILDTATLGVEVGRSAIIDFSSFDSEDRKETRIWRIGGLCVDGAEAVDIVIHEPGVYWLETQRSEDAGGPTSVARKTKLIAGVGESSIIEAISNRSAYLILAINHFPRLMMIPLDITGAPATDDDGFTPASNNGDAAAYTEYVLAQLCEHLSMVRRGPFVSNSEITTGLYVVYPKTVLYLGLSGDLRAKICTLVGNYQRDISDPDAAIPQEVMKCVTEIIDEFSLTNFFRGVRFDTRSEVHYPLQSHDTGLTRWLRSAKAHHAHMHQYFAARGFDSRRSRTPMLINYNLRDGTLGTRFANRSSATSRAATTLFDTMTASAGRHIGRNEMLSDSCTNKFREQFGAGGGNTPSLPGSVDDYALTYVNPSTDTMTFSNGNGDALTYMGGTYYERNGNTITWTSEDGREYVAIGNKDGTYDIEGSDGMLLENNELPEAVTVDNPDDTGSDGDDGDGGQPSPLAPVTPFQQLVQAHADMYPERLQRMVAMAKGGGRIYPSPGGITARPSQADFEEAMGDFPGLQRDGSLINPGRTGGHHGARAPGRRPIRLSDTPGVFHRAPGPRRKKASRKRRKKSSLLNVDFSDWALVLEDCFQDEAGVDAAFSDRQTPIVVISART